MDANAGVLKSTLKYRLKRKARSGVRMEDQPAPESCSEVEINEKFKPRCTGTIPRGPIPSALAVEESRATAGSRTGTA
jgi:hypothetical protein